MSELSDVPSWSAGLCRTGGYYQDPDWYNYNIARRMPLVPKMIQELVFALPPLGEAKVLDLLSGSGACSVAVKKAYPRCRLSILDKSQFRLEQCRRQLQAVDINFQVDSEYNIELNFPCEELPGGPFDVIVATLAFHSLAGHQAQEEGALNEKYSQMFLTVKNSLKPGGMLIFGDHVGTWGLYKQIRTLEEVGFTDLDIAWREEAYFVAGGRKPKTDLIKN